ncbi:PA1136 family autoinducer-binding transcriptional regulator [Roseinatronobacter sp. NSM]|uniref:PA1136 family autoinducer-binding transcriptional regulator n=1 Tax=Roseinatronobacter sp. NSM TaxID=3457785 RepID=UPI004036DC35
MIWSSGDTAFDALLRVSQAESLQQMQETICRACAPLGYDRILLFAVTTQEDVTVDRIFWIEGDWFGDGTPVDADTYLARCPVTRHVLNVREPFFWTKTETQGYQVVRKPTGSGINGFQVPVYGPIGLEGVASFGGPRLDASGRAQLFLSLLGVAAFRRSRQLVEGHDSGTARRLSDREREVLGLIAAGRRQAEIAAALGISGRTVENHLRNIRHRIGVKTTAQAVQAAIRLGELTLSEDA